MAPCCPRTTISPSGLDAGLTGRRAHGRRLRRARAASHRAHLDRDAAATSRDELPRRSASRTGTPGRRTWIRRRARRRHLPRRRPATGVRSRSVGIPSSRRTAAWWARRSRRPRSRHSSRRWSSPPSQATGGRHVVRRAADALGIVPHPRDVRRGHGGIRGMSSGRVAVTGVGLITAVGPTRESTWSCTLDGRCGIRDVTLFETAGYRSRCGGEIEAFDMTGLSRRERRRWSRSDQLAVVAAREALEDAGLTANGSRSDARRCAFRCRNRRSPAQRGLLLHHARPRHRSRAADAHPQSLHQHPDRRGRDAFRSSRGLRTTVVSACSSSSIAIGYAADLIRAGRLDAAVCGGSDALSRLTFSGFNALRLMDPAPCRPFDATRAGMNIGEGAGILVLEDWERARRRGASIYAELAGYALTCEAFHATAPEPDGHAIADTIRLALGIVTRHGRRRGSRERARHGDASKRSCGSQRIAAASSAIAPGRCR